MSNNKQHRVLHEFYLSKKRTVQLGHIALATNTKHVVSKIIRAVCDFGFYHWQLSHDDELMARLEQIALDDKTSRSEIVRHAVAEYIRQRELS